jgi:iron-sulfur cluster repair protein YtfE (RIC family)
MNIPRKATIIACLAATFVAGGIAGGFVGAQYEARSRPRGPFKPEDLAKRLLDHCNDELHLSFEQKDAFRAIIKEYSAKIDSAHHRMGSEVRELFHEMDEKLMDHLSAEQKTAFIEMKSKWRQGPPRMKTGPTNSPPNP